MSILVRPQKHIYMINAKRLFDLPHDQLKDFPSDKMFVTKKDWKWVPTSTQEFINEVIETAKGLIAYGVQAGDNVGIVSKTRYEWNVMDMAIQHVGAIVVPFYPNISESDYEYIFNDAKINLCVLENEELATKISNIKDKLPLLNEVFTMEEVVGQQNWSVLKNKGKDIDFEEIQKRIKDEKSG